MCKVSSLFLRARVFLGLASVISTVCYAVQEEPPGPAETPPPASNVQVMNATSVEKVDFRVRGLRDYIGLVQGARISGGAFPITDWNLEVSPTGATDQKSLITAGLKLKPGASSTFVLVGDFLLIKGQDGKEKLRAALIDISNDFSSEERPNRLVVVNGCPDQEITVSIDGQPTKTIAPLIAGYWTSLPVGIDATAKVGAKSIPLPIEFIAPVQSAVVAFYMRGSEPDFVVMPQGSLR